MKTSKRSTKFVSDWNVQIGALVLVALAALPLATVKAAPIEWKGGTASYNTPADWVGGAVPGSSDSAINDNSSNNVVQINIGDPDWTVSQIMAGDGAGDGAFVQNGQNVHVTGTNYNASVVTPYFVPFRLGIVAGDTGIYTLNGGTLNYTNAGSFDVGELGTGVLNINGGTITGDGNFADNLGVSATPTAVTATVGGGLSESDYTWFEQGAYAANTALGLPAAGSTITSSSLADHVYAMPPSYAGDDAVMVASNLVNATITLTSPMVCSNLSLVGSAGNGPVVVNYTVHHADSSTETGSISVPDWFGPAANASMEVLGGVGARVDALGVNFQTVGEANGLVGTAPYLFSLDIALTNFASAVDSIDLAYVSGGSVNSSTCLLGISGQSPSGGSYSPLAMTGYNEDMIIGVSEVVPVASTVSDTVNQTNGAISITGQMFVGNFGAATYNLSGGSIDVYNYIAFGRSGGSGTFNMTGGTLNQDGNGNLLVGTGFGAPAGGSAVGMLNQSGGTITCQGQFLCPEESPSSGSYNLGGTGTLAVNNWLAIGRSGGAGVVNMNGGSITKGGDNSTHLDIGASGNGTLNQTNGTITNVVSTTYLGESGNGTWNLEGGAATLGLLEFCVNGSASGTLNLDGGLIQVTGINAGGAVAISTLNFNGGTLQAGGNSANFMSGLYQAAVGNGGAVIDSQGYNITIAQALQNNGNGGLIKQGTGTLTLTGANNYVGDTVVNAGTVFTSTGSSNPGNVTVADNAGFGVTVQSVGAQFTAANLTLGSSAGAVLSFDMGAFGNPSLAQAPLVVNAGGTFTKSGTITVNVADALPQLGDFPLVQYQPGGLAGTGNFVLGSLPTGVTATIITNAANNSIDLNIIGVNQPRWDGEAGGTWDTGADTNWVNIGTGLPTTYTDPSAVVFNDSALGATNVIVAANVNPSGVTVTNNVLNYAFVGTGKIGGSKGLTKQGTGSLAILNTGGNSYTGPTVISGGTLSVTNLANGGSPSAIGASSASPTNLVLAGGTLSYGGSPVTINRNYSQTASTTIDAEGSLTLTGLGQATVGTYVKTGPGTLTYAGTGTNVLSVTSGAFSAQVLNGTLILGGSTGGQTNIEGGEFYVGSGTTTGTGASLVLTNTTVNCNTWFAIARGNGTSGLTSTASLYNSTLTCPGGLSLCYANGLSGYLANGVLSLYGNSQLIDGGAANICEANSGGYAVVNVTNSASLLANGTTYIGNTLSKGVLNLNSTGTSTLGNASGAVFRVGGGANAGDTGVGAINQSAGTLISGSNSVYLAIGIGGGANCYGSYNLSGGTFTRNFGIRVGRSGLASFVQSGGTFTCGGEFSLSSTLGNGNGVAAGTFTGGSTTINSGNGFRVPDTSSFAAAVNIGTEAGGNASVVTLFSSGFQLCYGAGNGTGTLNLESGTLQLGGPISKVTGGSGTGIVNLNSGTVQAGGTGITLLNATPNSVNVYKGGLTVDSMANTATITANLLATAGNGAYPAGGIITVPANGGAGYIGAPLVAVSGGSGSGMQTVATISNGSVTNVVITCPGQNYLAGDNITFAFSGGGFSTAASSLVYTLQAGDVSANAGGGLTKVGTGVLYLNGVSTYTGTNRVSNGVLAGTGSVAGAVTVAAGGTLAAGSSSTSIGTFTISGLLSFAGGSTNFMKINKTGGTKDLLTGMSQATYGGTLVVSNQAGTLASGDSFKLFNAAGYSGAFSAIVPATPGTGLAWNTNQLTVNGTLLVAAAVNTNPTNITFSVTGGSLNLSWPVDHLGWRLQVQTNSLTVGLGTNWVTWPNSTNLTSVSTPVNSTNPTVFFRLIYP